MSRKVGREADRLARLVEAQGFRVRRTKSGYVVYAQDGRRTAGWHRTASDHRARKNLLADLRRIGVEI